MAARPGGFVLEWGEAKLPAADVDAAVPVVAVVSSSSLDVESP